VQRRNGGDLAMTEPPGAPEPVATLSGTRSLQALQAELFRARSAQRATQGGKGADPEAMAVARWATLQALEDYAAALESRSWPVPRRIHQDIQLHRALCRHRPSRSPLPD
jgi:hypothetical protein